MATHDGEKVGTETRQAAHTALDEWLDRCGERPLRWDDGEFHSIKFEAGVVGYDNNDNLLWSLAVERREREDL